MTYLLLIVEPVGQRRERTEQEGRALYDRMVQFGERLQARGVLRETQSLRSTTEAARVRVRGGKRTVTDGPFSESKEMVGGFFLVECGSREEALAIAAECPAAEWATVEVRESGPCFT